MKFSAAWLQEWLDVRLDPKQLIDQLTMAGLEVDKTRKVSADVSGIVVGRVKQVKPHPSADRLQICMVDVGDKALLQIVCGAPNVYKGMHAPTALVGAQLNEMTVTERSIRGVSSAGMLCSARELGMVFESDGLLDLGEEVSAGTDCVRYLWLDDTIVEIDLTPNRADCFSIQGIAKEVAAIAGAASETYAQNPVAAEHDKHFPVTVVESEACPRYLSRVVNGINPNAKTPIWMKERLCRSGLRPVYPIVDIMNYVMLELGQPLHAFDISRLDQDLTVRFADKEETLALLDSEREVKLTEDTLIIASGQEPVAIAGIIGGHDSAVTADTRDILIECAFFHPKAVAGKARLYGLHTEASRRFERGVDFCLQRDAMEYACELINKICGGQFGPTTETVKEECLPEVATIQLRYSEIIEQLGVTVDRYWVQRTLGDLGIKTKVCKGGWFCTIPTYRFDLSIEADLVEEIGRMHGYDQIPVNLPQTVYTPLSTAAKRRQFLNTWRDKLVSAGYLEVITYSFADPELLQSCRHSAVSMLSNPISPALAGMRTSLWPGLLNTLTYNLNHQQDRLRIFEVGKQFLEDEGQLRQPLMLAGLVYGSVYPEQWGHKQGMTDFYDMKSDIERLLAYWHGQVSYQAEKENPGLHPGKAAKITLDGQVIGCFGALNPELEAVFNVPSGVFLFEIELEKIPDRDVSHYRPISRYPAVRRDISMLVPETVNVADLTACILADKPESLRNVFLFDMYRGENMEKGQKSVAYGLIFQDFSDTLYEQIIEEHIASIVANLKRHFDIQIRRK